MQTVSQIAAIPIVLPGQLARKAPSVREVLQVRRVFPAQEARLALKDLRG